MTTGVLGERINLSGVDVLVQGLPGSNNVAGRAGWV